MSVSQANLKLVSSEEATHSQPLCVDLDGSLIHGDLLHEAIFLLLRKNFLTLFLFPLWLMHGKAHFKMQVALRGTPNPKLLPYRLHVLDRLRQEKKNNRTLVLATAANEVHARAVAKHLGLFDTVEASSSTINLNGKTKAQRLVSLYGAGGFDYLGNSRADIPVWEDANKAIVVGDEKAALRYADSHAAERISSGMPRKSRLRLWMKAVRVHQWLKNSLLFVPAILASHFTGLHEVAALLVAFFAFSFCASSVYLFNDLLDIEADRQHRSKFARPIPSGLISPLEAVLASVGLIAAAFGLSLLLPLEFTLVLGGYLLVTTLYSFLLKRMLLIDTLTLAGLFAIRVFAGSAAISAPVSTWLLAFCMFFFLSLALVKRFVELDHQAEDKGLKATGRGYQAADLEILSQGGLASGFAAVVVLALFIDSPAISANYTYPELIWLVCPLVLYLVVRIWILARRKQMNDDPVVFLMTDWRSQLMIAAGAIVMLVSQMV